MAAPEEGAKEEKPQPLGLPTAKPPTAPQSTVPNGLQPDAAGFWYSVPELPDLSDGERFETRRQKVMKALPQHPLILFGTRHRKMDRLGIGIGDGPGLEKNFYYLTGLNEQEAVLILAPKQEKKQRLFLRPEKIRHYQDRKDQRLSSFDEVQDLDQAAAAIRETIATSGEIPVVHGIEAEFKQDQPLAKAVLEALGKGKVEQTDFAKTMVALREIKDDVEIRLIERACAITANGYLAAFASIADLVPEKTIRDQVLDAFRRSGSSDLAFPIIAGAGANSAVIHYTSLKDNVSNGSLILMDIGAECEGYASDISRTFPVSGTWTQEQLGLYNLVYNAQLTGLSKVKPGETLISIHETAAAQLDQWKSTMMHGVSHHVGLYVHDIYDYRGKLKPGMVITVEPGVYLPHLKIGVRIEDTVLVTEDGYRLLSSHIPKDPAALSELIRKAKAAKEEKKAAEADSRKGKSENSGL